MREKIGEIAALFRYPVKSMAGESLNSAELGWHGIAGDRRLGLRRIDDRGGFPWLNASKLPELVRFVPCRPASADDGDLPSHVRTPDGDELPLFSRELAESVFRRHGSPVEMMHLNRGIFDEASISMITAATVGEITSQAGQPPDVRRFRPNILISTVGATPFQEDEWVGGTISFGDSSGVTLGVTNWDVRCSMVNIDPDTAERNAEVLKTVVRLRDKRAGVYCTVTRRGRLTVGQAVFIEKGD